MIFKWIPHGFDEIELDMGKLKDRINYLAF